MSKPISPVLISEASEIAWDRKTGDRAEAFGEGFIAGVRWAEQQLAASTPEPAPAQEPDLSWVAAYTVTYDGTLSLHESLPSSQPGSIEGAVRCTPVSRVVLHRKKEGQT